MRHMILILAFAAALLAFAGGARAQAYDADWFTIDCGGQTSVGGLIELSGTIGQPDASVLAGGGFELAGGFWTTVDAPGCGSADFDCDGDLGTDADIEAFFACLAGNCPAPPCPASADFNADGDLGTDADIEAFFRVLAGGSC
jgi:hypothetical protein